MKRILIADDNAWVRRGLRGLIMRNRNKDWDVCGGSVRLCALLLTPHEKVRDIRV